MWVRQLCQCCIQSASTFLSGCKQILHAIVGNASVEGKLDEAVKVSGVGQFQVLIYNEAAAYRITTGHRPGASQQSASGCAVLHHEAFEPL